MSKRSTRTSLLMSVVAMLLSVTMLMGSTFAWFTDSVTATNNVIVAGNLDVELYYQNDETTNWTEVGTTTNVFKENTLWEPGHVEVIKLMVANEGTLALKYNLGINIANELGSVNKDGQPFKLSDYIYFGVVEGDQNYTREQAVAAVSGSATLLKTAFTVEKTLMPAGDANDNKIVTVVVYMPESVGNEANYGKDQVAPKIDLGINVFATQFTNEYDSFGKDYDKDATYPASTTNKVEGGETLVAGETSVELPAGLPEAEYTLAVDNKVVTTADNGDTEVSFEIELLKDGVKVDPVPGITYEVGIYVGENLNVSGVTHNDIPVTPFNYDAATGVVTFETDSFSPFAVTYYEGKIESVDTFERLIAKGGNFVLTNDLAIDEPIVIPAGVEATIDLNGKAIVGALNENNGIIENNGALTLVGGTVENTATNGIAAIYNVGTLVLDGTKVVGAPINGGAQYPSYTIRNAGNLTVEEGTEVFADRGCLYLSGNGETVINGGSFTNNDIASRIDRAFTSHVVCISSSAKNKLIINDGEFNHFHTSTSGGVVINNWSAVTVEINGGSFSGGNYFGKWDNLSDYGYGSTKTPFAVTGGTFTGFDNKFLAEGCTVNVLDDGKYFVCKGVYVDNVDDLNAAINAGTKDVTLAEGDYALRFTNNTNFNLNDMTIKGLGDVNLAISSSEAWYGRVQGSNVTFENIHFTSTVGATGEATYNNCVFDDWTICASSNKEETIFNNCTINGCLNTSTDFSSGDVFVKNCEIAKAEYSGSMTMNFVDCQIGEIIIWNANTNLTNCKVTKLDDSNVTTATVTIK